VPSGLTDLTTATVLRPKLCRAEGGSSLRGQVKMRGRAVCGRTACTVRRGAAGNTTRASSDAEWCSAPAAYSTTGFCAEMGAMDVRSEDVRAVRPRKRDNEWWTGRAYESRVSSPETPSWRRDQWRGSMAERAAGVE